MIDVKEKCKLYLAPMQGLTDAPMRDLLTRIGGFDECVSEFVRVTHTVHSRATWLKYVPEIAQNNQTMSGVACTVQLLGSDANKMAENALMAVQCGVEKIDLNFGCPAPTVNKHQGGAILLKEPERVFQIVKTVRQALPQHILLSGKMRLGFEDKALALDNACAIAEGGACELTVHARTKVEGYEPPAHWIWVRRIAESVAIPVVANGDVFCLADYVGIRHESGCERVMLGRGAVMRPDLARQIKQYERGERVEVMSFTEVLVWMVLFVDLCMARSAENKYAVARVKQWLGMLKKVYPEAHKVFESIRTVTEPEAVRLILHGLINLPSSSA